MIEIDTNELRRKLGSDDLIDHIDIHANVKPALTELLDRLEVAEKDAALKERVIDSLGSALNAAANERDALRAELAVLRSSMTFRTSLIGRIEAERDALQAKVEAMEKQKPVATVRINVINGNPSVDFVPGLHYLHHNDKLYLAPGAQPAPSIPEGWKLVPVEPTETMISEGSCASGLPGPHYISEDCAKQCWEYMLAAAPEAK